MSQLTPGPDHLAPGEPADTPTPVLDATKLGGLVSAAVVSVVGVVVLIGAGVTVENVTGLGLALGAAVTALTSLVVYVVSVAQGRKAAEAVTPLAKPRDSRGRRLVPENRHAA